MVVRVYIGTQVVKLLGRNVEVETYGRYGYIERDRADTRYWNYREYIEVRDICESLGGLGYPDKQETMNGFRRKRKRASGVLAERRE